MDQTVKIIAVLLGAKDAFSSVGSLLGIGGKAGGTGLLAKLGLGGKAAGAGGLGALKIGAATGGAALASVAAIAGGGLIGAYDANKTCTEMGIDCFDSDKEALYGEKIYENKKIRLTETEIHEIVKYICKECQELKDLNLKI